ncbi:MAG: hypothetical protein AAFQ67_04775, partial [Pseudomonadota bacterium]
MVAKTTYTYGAVLAAIAASACDDGGKRVERSDNDTACIAIEDLPEGTYTFENGVFELPANTRISVKDLPPRTEPIITRSYNAIGALGLSWLGLSLSDRVAVLTGEAPDDAAREDALTRGRDALEGIDGGDTLLVLSAISTPDLPAGPALGLVGLPTDADVGLCQAAFDRVQGSSRIAFATASSDILDQSKSLADALAGVAMRCSDHAIAIEGYAPPGTASDAAADISEGWAKSVESHFI